LVFLIHTELRCTVNHTSDFQVICSATIICLCWTISYVGNDCYQTSSTGI